MSTRIGFNFPRSLSVNNARWVNNNLPQRGSNGHVLLQGFVKNLVCMVRALCLAVGAAPVWDTNNKQQYSPVCFYRESSVLKLCEIIGLVLVRALKPGNGLWWINSHVFNPALMRHTANNTQLSSHHHAGSSLKITNSLYFSFLTRWPRIVGNLW